MTDQDASNAFVADLPPTAARTSAEEVVQDLRLRGGVFVEAVRATRMAMVLTDPALPGNPIVFANESFLKLSGYAMEEVLGQQPYFLHGPETDPRDALRFRKALADDHDETLQTIQYAKDGSRLVVSLFVTALKDDDGRTLHHLLSWRDVTRQIDAEEEVGSLRAAQDLIRHSEEKYRTLFEAIDSGFCIIEMIHGEDGRVNDYRFIEVNPAFERQSGLVDAVGRRVREFAPDLEEHWFERYGRVALTGEPMRVEGEVMALGRSFDINAFRVGAPGQHRVGALFTDITARRRAEERVRSSEERQAFLLNLSDALRAEPSADGVVNRALQMLSEHMKLDRCYIVIYRVEEDQAVFPHQLHDDSLSPLPAYVPLSDFPKGFELVSNQTLVIDNIAEKEGLSDADRENIEALGVRALLNATVRRGKNNPLWAIAAGSKEPHAWTGSEISLVEEVAERTWAAIERARAEAAMRESERRYRRVFFNNMVPMAVWTKSGEVAEANDALLELLGYTRAELDAGKLRWDEITPAEYRELDMKAIAEVEAKGFCTPYEKVFFHKDGRPISIIIGGGSLDENVGTGVFFAFDLTERKRAEKELASREQQFETLLDQAPIGVYLVDGDFVIRQVNPVAMPVFGDIEGGPVGRDFDEVIHILWDTDYADEVVRIFRHTLETGEPYVTAERAEHRSDRDTVEYYEWRLDRIILPDGRYGVVCYFRDISAQVHARKGIEKANELARESEERFRLAIDGSKIAIYECDLDLRYTWITNPVEGFTPDDIIGRLDRDLLSEKDAALLERFKRQALASEQPLEEEMHASPGGEARWFLMRAERLVDARGKVVGLRIVSLDITESKCTEAARRDSEDRLRLIVQSAQDYAIFTTDPDDVIDEWMPGAAAVFGFTKEEAEGQPCAIIFTPEDRAQNQPEKEIETALREGQAANVRWHIRKDGELVFIEGQVVPLRNPGGEVRGFLKIGQDVTERRIAEGLLRDSEERFRQFGEASSDLLWIRNAETLAFEYLSPAFETLYGVPREQVLQANDVKAWAELIHPDDRETGLDVLRKLRSGIPGACEFRVIRPDGSLRWLHDTNFPMRDDTGRVVRIAGIAQDVTERKRAVELQGTLVAELQHRVRNILAMIQAVVRRTRDTSDSAEEYARHLGGRVAAMARTQALLTRSAARQVNLEEILRDELMSVAAQEEQYWCEGPKVLLPPKAAEVLTLAIHELATNSVKYGAFSHAGGQIEIRWDTEKRDGLEWLAFEWEETRVPKALFEREGFGTELITRRVPYELRGTGTMELLDDGIRAKIQFPLVRSNSILETNIPEQLQ